MLTDPKFIATAGHLHAFLTRIARHHVRADFGSTLTLQCDFGGHTARIAHISPHGLVWTDAGVAKLPGAEAAAHRYVERLAGAWNLCLNRESFGPVWTVCDADNRLPNIEGVLGKLDDWAGAIEGLVDALAVARR